MPSLTVLQVAFDFSIMGLKAYLSDKSYKIQAFFSSSKGRDIILYLIFVAVAFVFWAILALNNQIQNNFHVKFEIADIPRNVTIINDYPKDFNVTVKNDGYALIKFLFQDDIEISVPFKDFVKGKDYLYISKKDIVDLLISNFGIGSNIISLDPEEIRVKFTTLPGKKVPVEVAGDFSANFQYVINGKVRMIPDSVTIYSDATHLNTIERAFSEKVVRRNLTDSLYLKVSMEKMSDVRIVPDSIDIMIPVEPLVTKHSNVAVSIENVPDNMKLVVFPAMVRISYLIPMSMYDAPLSPDVKAFVDYKDITSDKDKLPVKLGDAPAYYNNIQLLEDSVEYIIER